MIRPVVAWTFLAVGVLLAGCGGSGTTSSAQEDPKIRFINASPATTGLDLVLNENVQYANVAFRGSSADFQEIEFLPDNPDGGYDVSIRSAGGTVDLDILNNEYGRNTDSLILAFGLQNPGGELLKRAQVTTQTIDRKAPTGNRARLIVLNSLIRSTGFENVPITYQSIIPGDPTSIDNPQFRISDIQYGNTQITTIDSGERTFIARRGEVDALQEFARSTFTFQPGRIYLVLITGQEANANPALQPRIEYIELQTEN